MRYLGMVAALVLWTGFVMAQEAKLRGSGLEPFLSSRTVLAGHVDMERVNLEQTSAWIVRYMEHFVDAGQVDEMQRDMAGALVAAQSIKTATAAQGAKDLYIVMNTGMLMQGAGGAIVITGARDPDALGKELAYLIGQTHVVKQGAVAIGAKRAIEQLASDSAEDAPTVSAAFALSGQPAVLAVMIPQDMREMMLRQDNPVLPGGATVGDLLDAFNSALVELSPGEKMSVKATVICGDEEGATLLADTARAALSLAKDEAARGQIDLSPVVRAVAPEQQESMLTVTLEDADLQQIAVAMGPAVQRARTAALRVQSASNIRSLMQMFYMARGGKDQQVPEDLQAIVRVMNNDQVARQILRNPQRPDLAVGYIYVKPTEETFRNNPSERLVMFEAYESWPGGVNVGFADGHVEWVADQQRVERLIEAAKKP